MMAASLVDQAQDDLNALTLLLTVLSAGVAVAGPKLLDEGHRVRKNGVLTVGLALIGLALTVSQLILMGGLEWSSATSHGPFQPWLLMSGVYFLVTFIVALALLWLIFKAIGYIRLATGA